MAAVKFKQEIHSSNNPIMNKKGEITTNVSFVPLLLELVSLPWDYLDALNTLSW